MTIYPSLNDINSSTKDKIIGILATNPGINTKKVDGILKKQYAINVTYQAIHKTLKQMVEQRIILYDKRGYMLNPEWVKQLRTFVEKCSADGQEEADFSRDIDYKKLVESKESKKIILKTREEFDEFYYKIRKHLTLSLKDLPVEERLIFRSFWHLYYPLAHPKEEAELIDIVKEMKAKSFTFVIGDTPLDSWAARIYKNSPVKVFLGELIASTNMIFIYGNKMMDVYYDYSIVELFDKVFNQVKQVDSLALSQAVSMLYAPREPIYITINNDPSIVNTIKKLFTHRLNKYDIYLETKDYEKEFEDISNLPFLKETVKHELDGDTVVVNRKSRSFIIKKKNETGDIATRIIVIPPHGFTGNYVDELNCHPEVRYAKLTIRGGIRKENNGYIKLKPALKYLYYITRKVSDVTDFAEVRADYNNEFYREEVKSSNETFYVVKEDGEGFYHNLVNISNDWLVLVLSKYLKDLKTLDLEKLTANFNEDEKNTVRQFVSFLKNEGDELFYTKPFILAKVMEMNVSKIIPVLISLLNIPETGKHEQCTVFAIILKFSKKHSQEVLKHISHAALKETAPSYYLEELIDKIKKHSKEH